MGLYVSPFVLLGTANTFTKTQSLLGGVSVGGGTGYFSIYQSGGSTTVLEQTNTSQTSFVGENTGQPGNYYFQGSVVFYANSSDIVLSISYSPVSVTFDTVAPSFAAGLSIASGQSITGSGSLNLTGTGEFGGLFTAAGGIETAGGGTAPGAFSPGASGVATAVSTSRNVTLICTAAGTQSADGEINGTSIGAQWAAGMVVPLKANDTVTWTGTAAPTFLYMYA